ncbi:MAG: rhamnulokinase [Kiritimatiellia bacterium]
MTTITDKTGKQRHVLAIDLGASGGKCFAGTFDSGSFSLQEVYRFPHEAVTLYVEDSRGTVTERLHWDDLLLWRSMVTGLEIFRREVAPRLDAVGVDTWGADGQLLDPNGEALGKIYCYRDHRLDAMREQLTARMPPERLYELTGIHFQPFNLSNQLLWLLENRRDLVRPGCLFLPIPSLFYFYLSGVRKVDSTWASVTQLMDARRRQWSNEILDALGIPCWLLPEVVEPATIVGSLHENLARAVGLNRAALVAVASHDTASAFLAAPIHDQREALIISSGTWSLVGKLIPEPITTVEAMQFNISNEGGVGNIRCLKNCMGTWIVQELRRVWRTQDGKEMAWQELLQLAESAEPFAVLIDPDYPGFYNPPNMETAIIEFCRASGQPLPAGRGSFVRAVYESLALKYRMVEEQISRVTKTNTRFVHIVGGAAAEMKC